MSETSHGPQPTSRERLLTALDGGEPDRVPRALSFYRIEIEAILPPHARSADLVDVGFVRFPPSPEEEELERRAMPYPGDTRLGHPAQVRNYARWRYHPEAPDRGNPLARARSLEDLRSFPFPDLSAPYAAEGLALDDDVGMPGRMMISPRMWREFFQPRLAEIIRAARAIKPDLRVLYHSDGHIEPILGDLVEIGVNAVNPVQPEYMDARRIRRRFGPRLALWGTIGHQTTFSFAMPDEIREEVRERIATLGRAGLVLCPAYDIDEPDVPWENVAAFLRAAADFG